MTSANSLPSTSTDGTFIVVTAKFANGKKAHWHFVTVGGAVAHVAVCLKSGAVSVNVEDKRASSAV